MPNRRRRKARPAAHTSKTQVTGGETSVSHPGLVSPEPALEWEIDVPLVTNWVVLGGLLKAFGITGILVAALLSLISAITGEWETIPRMVMIAGAVTAGLFVLGLLGALLVYGNRMRMQFRIDSKGVDTKVTDRRSKAVSTLLVIFGMLARRPGVVGTGVLAGTGRRQSAAWKRITSVRFSPRWQTVSLVDGWHTAAVLFCRPDNYESVADRVRSEMARHAHAPNTRTKHSLPSKA